MKYEKEIINIINKNIHLSNLTGKIDIDTNLCDLGFDSISFIRVIIEIEDKFNIEFPEENLLKYTATGSATGAYKKKFANTSFIYFGFYFRVT